MTSASNNSKKLRAIELVARGWSKGRIADELGVSERTIRRWTSNSNNASRATSSTGEVVNVRPRPVTSGQSPGEIRKRYFEKLEGYRQEGEDIGNQLIRTGQAILDLVTDAIDRLSEEKLESVSQISSAHRVASSCLDMGTKIKAESLGVEGLMENMRDALGDDFWN